MTFIFKITTANFIPPRCAKSLAHVTICLLDLNRANNFSEGIIETMQQNFTLPSYRNTQPRATAIIMIRSHQKLAIILPEQEQFIANGDNPLTLGFDTVLPSFILILYDTNHGSLIVYMLKEATFVYFAKS